MLLRGEFRARCVHGRSSIILKQLSPLRDIREEVGAREGAGHYCGAPGARSDVCTRSLVREMKENQPTSHDSRCGARRGQESTINA